MLLAAFLSLLFVVDMTVTLCLWQVGRDAAVHLWDAENVQTVSILKGGISRGVCAVDFSSTHIYNGSLEQIRLLM